MKDILKVTFVIIGTMIGAGFASGQEIYLFFNKFEIGGIIGLIFSGILTGIIIYKVFKILQNKPICTYSEFLLNLNSNKKVNNVIEIMVQAFLVVSFFIMVAGFGAYFKQEFQLSSFVLAAVMAFFCYVTFMKDTNGIISINAFLIPFLSIFIFYLGIKDMFLTNEAFEYIIKGQYFGGWLISAILYTSYNSILIIPILIELKKYMNTKRKILKTSILCTLILIILGVCLFYLLLKNKNGVLQTELPMIQIVKKFGNIYTLIYGGVILSAIFTSAIAAGYGFLKNINVDKKKYKKIAFIICLTSVVVAPMGFSNLVGFLYHIFGILGLIQFFYIFRA